MSQLSQRMSAHGPSSGAVSGGLDAVLARQDVWRGDQLAPSGMPSQPSGSASLDQALSGGWARGALTELLLDAPGLGELSLLLPALAAIKASGGWSLLIAPPFEINAPAWAAAGVDLSRLAVVCPLATPAPASQPRRVFKRSSKPGAGAVQGGDIPATGMAARDETDVLWAAEQALRSGSPAAVLCWTERLEPRQVRRLQVAAANSQSLMFLFRPSRAMAESSVAPFRLHLAAASEGRLRVDVLKRRGPPLGRPLSLLLPRPAAWRDHAAHLQVSNASSSPECVPPVARPASAPAGARPAATPQQRLSLARHVP